MARYAYLLPLLALLGFLALPVGVATAQDTPDQIYLVPVGNNPSEIISGGRLEVQTWDRIIYQRDTGQSQQLLPWQIQWVDYRHPGLPGGWQTAFDYLRNGNYRQASESFLAIIDGGSLLELSVRRGLDGSPREGQIIPEREYIIWATHYYAGYALNRLAEARELPGKSAWEDLQWEFPVVMNERQRQERAQAFAARPDLMDDAKAASLAALDSVTSQLGTNDISNEMRDAIEAAPGALELEEAVRRFPELYRSYAADYFTQAQAVLGRLFTVEGRESADGRGREDTALRLNNARPFWYYRLLFERAQALRGLGLIQEAIALINDDMVDGMSSSDEDPNLADTVVNVAASTNNRAYYNYYFRGYLFAAQCWLEYPDDAYGQQQALVAYRHVQQEAARQGQEFTEFVYEANLRFGRTQARESWTSAMGHYRGLLRTFLRYEPDTSRPIDDPGFFLTPTQARLFAGCYIGQAEAQLIRASQEIGDEQERRDARAQALHYFLVVTAMFSTDRDRRAQALYYASRLYREIAEDELAEDFADQPERIPGPSGGSPRPNPYHYYMSMSRQLRAELQTLYPETEWANRE